MGSDVETEVEQWSDDDTAYMESDIEDDVPGLITPEGSDQELRLLINTDDDDMSDQASDNDGRELDYAIDVQHGFGIPDTYWDTQRPIPIMEMYLETIRYSHDPHVDWEVDCYIMTVDAPSHQWPGMHPISYVLYQQRIFNRIIHVRSRRFSGYSEIQNIRPETHSIMLAMVLAHLQDWAEPTRQFIGSVIDEIDGDSEGFPVPLEREYVDDRTDEEYFTADESSLPSSPSSYYEAPLWEEQPESQHPFF
jgi:hypothetical protein